MSLAQTASAANVLVVEDEMVLRMRAVDIVEDAGFTAVEAINADEALAILEARSDISLLFSDIRCRAPWTALNSPTRCMIAGLRSKLFWYPAKLNPRRGTSLSTAASLASRWKLRR
jgi:hypothetical protein